MKRIVKLCIWVIFGIVTLAAASCRTSGGMKETEYIPGVYEGTGRGYSGPVHVQIQVSAYDIEDITITGCEDGRYPGKTAMEELLDLVLEHGSTDLDAVSGTTFSSRGFLEAVEDAVAKAKL